MRKLAALLAVLALLLPGATAVRAQTVTPQTCFQPTYMVLPGETLYDISQLCRVPYLALLGINVEIRDPDKIWPGQVIRLVAEAPLVWWHQPISGPAQDFGLQPDGAYIVRLGDSLARIAFLYDTSVSDLLALNPEIDSSLIITPGQVLLMPRTAKHERGWVGVSALTASGGQTIEARVVDLTPYARVQFRLGIRGEEFDYQVLEARTDAIGSARVTMTLPYYAWEDEIWEVRVVNLDEGEDTRITSPGIRIDF